MPSELLFHVSDVPGIRRFEPRPPREGSGVDGDVVWAIDRAHLHNYLLPRDCPRVTFYAGPESAREDVDRLVGAGGAKHVVAIEARWLLRLRDERLHLYEFDSETFFLHDPIAGYYLSREPVIPVTERRIDDILETLLAHDIELRVLPSLWELRDAVVNSTLEFSIIRMRE